MSILTTRKPAAPASPTPPGKQRRAGRLRWVLLGLLALLVVGGALAWSRPTVRFLVGAGWKRLTADIAYRQLASEENSPPPAAVRVKVDAAQVLRTISPRIYGGAMMDQTTIEQLGLTTNRWGGNQTTRYNWVLGNATNAGRDWYFRDRTALDGGGDDTQPSSAADLFITRTLRAGAQPIISVPAMGWVAKDANNNTASQNVPDQGGPPLQLGEVTDAIPNYNPAANQAATSVRSLARKGAAFDDPPSRLLDTVFQDEWVNHLVSHFGPANQGGVPYYVIDNEPDLWSFTHTDVFPARQGYQQMLDTFLTYATAIKDVDPTASIIGPALSGWNGIQYSPLDQGYDNYQKHVERLAHGDTPFLAWWLQQVHQADTQSGRRSLDVLDVHYYPQGTGVFEGQTDAATNALRLRSTRSLWDPGYTDESWIREPVMLIPRLRQMIDQFYPGTQIAIGEWNYGADTTINGAVTIADVLGIYGREGVDMAEYWAYPAPNSPGAQAFKLYENVDGHGGSFGDHALYADSEYPDDVATYAGTDSLSGAVSVVLLNKRATDTLSTTVRLDNLPARAGTHAEVYQLNAQDPGHIQDLGPVDLSANPQVTLQLPATSATVLRVSVSQ